MSGSNGHCTYGIWPFFHRTCIGRVWPLHTSVILCTPHRVPFHYAYFCTTIRSCAVLWSSPTLFGSLCVCIIQLAKSKIRLNLVNTDCKKILYFDKSLLYSRKMKEGSPLINFLLLTYRQREQTLLAASARGSKMGFVTAQVTKRLSVCFTIY